MVRILSICSALLLHSTISGGTQAQSCDHFSKNNYEFHMQHDADRFLLFKNGRLISEFQITQCGDGEQCIFDLGDVRDAYSYKVNRRGLTIIEGKAKYLWKPAC